MKRIVKTALLALALAGAPVAPSVPASAAVDFSLSLANAPFGYSDCYWDRAHHWHAWHNRAEANYFRDHFRDHYVAVRHDHGGIATKPNVSLPHGPRAENSSRKLQPKTPAENSGLIYLSNDSRKTERDEFRLAIPGPDRNDDILLALIQIGHGNAGHPFGEFGFPQDRASRLVEGAEFLPARTR
jgi:hypothetical protein